MPHCFKRVSLGLTTVLAVGALFASAALAATIVGTPGNDRLRGSQFDDQIDAKAGNDVVRGFRGNDDINGGQGADRLFGNAGNDTIQGLQGPDRIWGNSGDDVLTGDVPNAGDRISPDRIFGGPGNDTINGGDGNDRLHGGPGNDTSNGQGGDDVMSGGIGDDTQSGGPGDDTIFANRGRDTTSGGPGNDHLWALARGDVNGPNDTEGDTLRGDDGDDVIRTRDGEADVVNCGAGNDRAILDFKDVIEDATADNPNGSCELVERKPPRRKDAKSEDRTQDPQEDHEQH
jgi:Ca2+-binding RTX toxin-like protein